MRSLDFIHMHIYLLLKYFPVMTCPPSFSRSPYFNDSGCSSSVTTTIEHVTSCSFQNSIHLW